jgi:hypothetical protein
MTDPEIFFPTIEKGQATLSNDIKANTVLALRLCSSCEIRQECLEYAMTCRETIMYGIYGGTLEGERQEVAGYIGKRLNLSKTLRAYANAHNVPTYEIPAPPKEIYSCITKSDFTPQE